MHRIFLSVSCALIAACSVSGEPGTAGGADTSLSDVLTEHAGATEGASDDVGGFRRTLTLDVTELLPGGMTTFTVTGAEPNEVVHLTRSTSGVGAGPCLGTDALLCLDIVDPKVIAEITTDGTGVGTLDHIIPSSLPTGSDMWFQAVAARDLTGSDWAKSTEVTAPIGDAVPTVCDPLTEVEYDGACYYLDGSGGACDAGYELASQDVLNTIASDFIGLDYKNAISGNCCIWHADQDVENQDWGMNSQCNGAGPFTEGPVMGGAGCTDALNLDGTQLTLCKSI